MPINTEQIKDKNARISETTHDEAMLWKRRYETSCYWCEKIGKKDRTQKIIDYLHNDYKPLKGKSKIFFNLPFISLKTLLPMVVAHNPFVAVSAENDFVYEYGKDKKRIMDTTTGQPIKHDVNKIAETFQILLTKRLKTGKSFKWQIRNFLRDAIAFNRGIFLVGHTLDTSYKGSFNESIFHPYIISVPPYRIKRQAGTTRIDEGTYFFYEYDVPISSLKGDKNYNQELLKQCDKEVLSEVKMKDGEDYSSDDKSGYYDDVKYYKLRNAYDLLTGEIKIFGKGCDFHLNKINPEYSFKNPSAEFIPNELFQPGQKEPISDLMMGDNILKQGHKIIQKAVQHVQD